MEFNPWEDLKNELPFGVALKRRGYRRGMKHTVPRITADNFWAGVVVGISVSVPAWMIVISVLSGG